MKIDAKAILAQARSNQDALRSCPQHRFPTIGKNYRMGQKVVCEKCGGEMNLRELGSYIRGFQAAGGNATDVLEDWGL